MVGYFVFVSLLCFPSCLSRCFSSCFASRHPEAPLFPHYKREADESDAKLVLVPSVCSQCLQDYSLLLFDRIELSFLLSLLLPNGMIRRCGVYLVLSGEWSSSWQQIRCRQTCTWTFWLVPLNIRVLFVYQWSGLLRFLLLQISYRTWPSLPWLVSLSTSLLVSDLLSGEFLLLLCL